MHIQSRARTAKSPPDLAAFLEVLADTTQNGGAINIEGVTGSDIEVGGEFVFCVEDGREDDTRRALEAAGYNVTQTEVWHQALTSNSAGELLAAIQAASTVANGAHQVIKDVLIGQETGDGSTPGGHFVQVAFQELKI